MLFSIQRVKILTVPTSFQTAVSEHRLSRKDEDKYHTYRQCKICLALVVCAGSSLHVPEYVEIFPVSGTF